MAKKRPATAKQMRLAIPPETHRRLKVAAAVAGTTMPKLAVELLGKHLPKV